VTDVTGSSCELSGLNRAATVTKCADSGCGWPIWWGGKASRNFTEFLAKVFGVLAHCDLKLSSNGQDFIRILADN
jgi:hypothetical protein